MRIKRHDFIYELERSVPRTEAVKSIESTEKFVKEIMGKIQKANTQKRLF